MQVLPPSSGRGYSLSNLSGWKGIDYTQPSEPHSKATQRTVGAPVSRLSKGCRCCCLAHGGSMAHVCILAKDFKNCFPKGLAA